jgi:hypothetical protein
LSRRAAAKRESVIEVFMPMGMRLFTALYWIAGLSGMMLGILVMNQGFFETYFDIQILLITQGSALLILASIMFLVAVGMISGAKWSLDIAKRIAAIAVGWSAVGIVIAVYTAYDLTGMEYMLVLYGIVAWLFVFGIVTGLLGLRYLTVAGGTVRKYAEYVTTEPLAFQYGEEPKRLPVIRRSHLRCIDCGSELKAGAKFCPECGATQLAQGAD